MGNQELELKVLGVWEHRNWNYKWHANWWASLFRTKNYSI